MKYKYKDWTMIHPDDVMPIVELVRNGRIDEAEAALKQLCLSVKDMPNFAAHHLAIKIMGAVKTGVLK